VIQGWGESVEEFAGNPCDWQRRCYFLRPGGKGALSALEPSSKYSDFHMEEDAPSPGPMAFRYEAMQVARSVRCLSEEKPDDYARSARRNIFQKFVISVSHFALIPLRDLKQSVLLVTHRCACIAQTLLCLLSHCISRASDTAPHRISSFTSTSKRRGETIYHASQHNKRDFSFLNSPTFSTASITQHLHVYIHIQTQHDRHYCAMPRTIRRAQHRPGRAHGSS